jgi:hypothetical protein
MSADNQPSDLFVECIVHSGSLIIDCGLCGVTHFAEDASPGDWEEGELKELMAKKKLRPNDYMGWPCHSVSWGNFLGYQIVPGCPCRKARRLEDILWGSRRIIMEYMKKRSDNDFEVAKRQKEAADGVELQDGEKAMLYDLTVRSHEDFRSDTNVNSADDMSRVTIDMPRKQFKHLEAQLKGKQ